MINSFSGQYKFLSNFEPCEVMFDGWKYPSVEHAYQAAKSSRPRDRLRIRRMKNPGRAKAAGKTFELPKDWEEIKRPLMLTLLRRKFQDERLRSLLVGTGEHELVEGNWWGDTYWGVCKGVGDNHLGRLLMKVREEVRRRSRPK